MSSTFDGKTINEFPKVMASLKIAIGVLHIFASFSVVDRKQHLFRPQAKWGSPKELLVRAWPAMHSPGVLGKPELRNDSQPKLFKVEFMESLMAEWEKRQQYEGFSPTACRTNAYCLNKSISI